jgi:hypothetical protein
MYIPNIAVSGTLDTVLEEVCGQLGAPLLVVLGQWSILVWVTLRNRLKLWQVLLRS